MKVSKRNRHPVFALFVYVYVRGIAVRGPPSEKASVACAIGVGWVGSEDGGMVAAQTLANRLSVCVCLLMRWWRNGS